VAAKRQGAVTRYLVTDPLVKNLLQVAKRILNRRLVSVRMLLRELEHDSVARA